MIKRFITYPITKFFRNKDYYVGSIFGASSVITGVVSMVVGIVIIRWIDPAQLGIWQSLTIIQLYLPILESGIPNGLNRELPYQYGKGNREKGVELAQTAQTFMLGNSALFLLATTITVPVLFFLDYDLKIVVGALVIGLMVTLNAYDRYLSVTYRSSEAFIDLSKIQLVRAGAQIVFFPLVYFFAYYGLLVYSLLVILVFVTMKHIRRPIPAGPAWNKENFIKLVKTGLPVFGMNYMRGISNSFNKIILLAKGSVLQVGLFTPVTAIGIIITMLPGILGNYFFPKMNIRLGQTGNPAVLWPMVLKLNGIMMILAVPFVIFMWFASPYALELFFPEYISAARAMQLFSLNMFFAGTLISHGVIYATKSYKLGLIFSVAEFSLKFICPFLCVALFSGNILTLLTVGILVSGAILFLLNIFLIRLALFPKILKQYD